MNTETFEAYIKKEINQDLFIEPTSQPDIDRVMIADTPVGTVYICAVPKEGVRDEVDPNYTSIMGQKFPSKDMIIEKIKSFLKDLPNNYDLYKQNT